MTLAPFCVTDIKPFLELASEEGWVAETWEFEFLLAAFPQGCFSIRSDDGDATGFVTSILHGQSGWIGNLIVPAKARGKGLGNKLFQGAMRALWQAGAETIWLTASKSGAPLYEKQGFTTIDTIFRWVGTSRQRKVERTNCAFEHPDWFCELDRSTWDDHRAALLAETLSRGIINQNESGFIVQQPCSNGVQLGPFSAVNKTAAEQLFNDALKNVPFGTKILVDAPLSNRSALALFNRKKMKIAGNNALMYAGKKPAYRPDLLYGLATMGSCG